MQLNCKSSNSKSNCFLTPTASFHLPPLMGLPYCLQKRKMVGWECALTTAFSTAKPFLIHTLYLALMSFLNAYKVLKSSQNLISVMDTTKYPCTLHTNTVQHSPADMAHLNGKWCHLGSTTPHPLSKELWTDCSCLSWIRGLLYTWMTYLSIPNLLKNTSNCCTKSLLSSMKIKFILRRASAIYSLNPLNSLVIQLMLLVYMCIKAK